MKRKRERIAGKGHAGKRRAQLMAAVLGLGIVLTACGSAEGTSTSGAAYEGSYSAAAALNGAQLSDDIYEESWEGADESANDAGDEGGSGDAEESLYTGNADTEGSTQRKLIVNMDFSVETTDLDAMDAGIRKKAEELGGYIESSGKDGSSWSETYAGSGQQTGTRYAWYKVRVPADRLDDFVTYVEEGSNVLSESASTEDITLRYSDTDARRQSLREEEKRLNEMMADAETVDEMIQIENALSDVRTKLQEIESRLKIYDNQVQYSTVNIDVTQTQILTENQEGLSWQERIAGGFSRSAKKAGETLEDAGVWIAANLPMILLWVAAFIVVILLLKLIIAILTAVFASREWKDKRKAKKRERKAEKKAAGKAKNEVKKKTEGTVQNQDSTPYKDTEKETDGDDKERG